MRYHGEYEPTDKKCDEPVCGWQAVDQDLYDQNLCEPHLRVAMLETAGDDAYKRVKESA